MNLNQANKFAKMANIAYKDEKEAKKEYKNLGWNNHIFLEHKGAQCYIVWNKDDIALCFRGTEPDEMSDVLADLNAFPNKSMTDGWVHAGFKGELNKLWSHIEPIASEYNEKNLYICGHSLGAAMATICTSRIEEFRKVEVLYTYGSPRAGTRSFVKGIKTQHWRFVNNNDIVTRVPLALMGYKHHGNLCYINHYGKIRKMTIWQRIKDKIRGYRSGLLDGAKDHSMENYVNYTIMEG
jgi:triacylglycerol lipase